MTKKHRYRSARYQLSPRELASIARWFLAFLHAIVLGYVQRRYEQLRENSRQCRLFGHTHHRAELARRKAAKHQLRTAA